MESGTSAQDDAKYKRRFQLMLILFGVTLAFLIAFVVLFGFETVSGRIRNTAPICTTKACIRAANMIMENIDPEVDPCEDFHMFSCGSFISSKRIPDEQTKLDVFDLLRNKLAYSVADTLSEDINDQDINATQNAKKLFKSCMNEGEENLLKILDEEFLGWPIIGPTRTNVTLVQRIVKLRRLGFKSIIDLHVSLNPKEPRSLIIKIRQPATFYNRQYYKDESFVAAYKQFMFKFVQLLNATSTDLQGQIERVLKFEKLFAMSLTSEEQKRNSTYRNVTIAQLIEELPQFDWKAFIIDGVFKDVKNVTIDLNEQIIVDDFNYLTIATKMLKEFRENNKTDLENLMIWTVIKNEVTFLPKKFRDIKLEFDRVYKGSKSLTPRTITCSSYLIDVMDFAVGRLYVSKHFNNQSKKAASEMIENIRQEFILILKEADWMDDESRELALAKYVMDEDQYLKNSMRILKLDVMNSLEELRVKRDRKNWISGPAIVNAFYSPFYNQICFPAGILQNPFYDAENPNYLNYGGIGSVIGHEITHGFDDRGRLHDKNGVYYADGVSSLWTNNTIIKYKEKTKCIINQYGNFSVKQINKTLNGITTQGENIADNGGLKEAYRAYKKWSTNHGPEPLLPGVAYNQEQLFFINYAQVWCTKYRSQSLLHRILNSIHSPGEFRIIGPTSNSHDFAKVFNCKSGQKNNPAQKCSVW